ncbi:SMI1/KNR4 family protein [Streptomyces sp. NPDC057963]|uniref:SMI1/KNR4 family protein n=1 Tax=Streptomyces sp. NPDC057963 TaxID=3346290 RepID=UPI0036E3F16B
MDIVLPADYKQLVQTYGGGPFAGVPWLLEPGRSDAMYDLVTQTAGREEILAELWEAGEDKPSVLHEVNARLVPWGYVEGAGHFLYWLVRPGAGPEEWTVILNEGRGPLWEVYPASCSQFLLDVVAGTTTSLTRRTELFSHGLRDQVVRAAELAPRPAPRRSRSRHGTRCLRRSPTWRCPAGPLIERETVTQVIGNPRPSSDASVNLCPARPSSSSVRAR